jgi:hypothetical protein
MTEEQWNELLELRAKAGLAAKTDHRFTLLEDFLSAQFHLSIYSGEEQERLRTQFSELSDQEQQDLISRVTQKTNPSFFYLSQAEVEKLRMGRKELSLHERTRLLSDLILSAAGTAWLDLGEVFEAHIEIDDNSSPDRWARPYAYISFSDGYRRRVETVDILESVRSNPAAIGHPAIVFAIHHWQRVIYARRVIERDDVTTRDEWGQVAKEVIGGGREINTAERNLKALGRLLFVGAKERATPKESALAIKMESLGLGLEDKQTSLYQAWELLEAKHIDLRNGTQEIVAKLEARLVDLENQPYVEGQYRRIPVRTVMEFLREEGLQGGLKYVGSNEEGDSLRPSWKIFRNAYAAWFFDLSQPVVQEYLEKAAKQNLADSDVYQPSWVSEKSSIPRILYSLLANQLVMVREPVLLSEEILHLKGIERAIEDSLSDE